MHARSTCSPQASPEGILNLLNSLEQYAISPQSGFVPHQPSKPLPDKFKAWEQLAESLPIILKKGNIVAEVNRLPLLIAGEASTGSQLQRAYVLLSFITHAYIHGGAQTVVPPALSDPLHEICNRLSIQPVITFSSLCIFNYRQPHSKDHKEQPTPTSVSSDHDILSGLRSVTTFTGTIDEEAFYLAPVLVERTGGPLIPLLLQALVAAYNKDFATVTTILSQCASTLQAMSAALSEMSLCNPDYFYNTIRPYIAGIDVTYTFSSGDRIQTKLPGGSAAQASLFPFLDHVLGVKHTNPLLGDMRMYMPGKHRAFLEEVFTLPTLPELMAASGAEADNEQEEIANKIKVCWEEMVSWRTKHLAIVSRYIVVPAAKLRQQRNGDVYESLEIAGTAGSSPLPFLKEIRDDVKTSQYASK